MIHTTTVNHLLGIFNGLGLSLADLIISIFARGFENHEFRRDLTENRGALLTALQHCPQTSGFVQQWAHQSIKTHYYRSARALTRKENGWHFGASHISPEQVLNFRIEDMAADMQRIAPDLWDLISYLVSGESAVEEVAQEESDEEIFCRTSHISST